MSHPEKKLFWSQVGSTHFKLNEKHTLELYLTIQTSNMTSLHPPLFPCGGRFQLPRIWHHCNRFLLLGMLRPPIVCQQEFELIKHSHRKKKSSFKIVWVLNQSLSLQILEIKTFWNLKQTAEKIAKMRRLVAWRTCSSFPQICGLRLGFFWKKYFSLVCF